MRWSGFSPAGRRSWGQLEHCWTPASLAGFLARLSGRLRRRLAALASIGENPHTRTGLVSAFGLRGVIEGGLDHEIGRHLRRLFDDREYVDYALGEAPPEQSLSAIGDAEDLLDAATRWIERRVAAA